jgi:glycosyltransferase involved in cell wall biosynthesis
MISIIIPTYNEEKYIGETLLNLKNKLTLPHEIIVTDDKSKDKTVEIARKYADIVLSPEIKHRTISANRNEGASKAKGEFLVFMDACTRPDDPNAFFTMALKDFEANSKIVAVTGALKIKKENQTFGDKIVYPITNLVFHIKNNIFHTGEASGKFQMMKREAFQKVGGFREDLVTREDADMFNRLSKIGRTFYDSRLEVFNSGRRAHAIGWPKLLCIWMYESFHFAVYDKSKATEWKDIR